MAILALLVAFDQVVRGAVVRSEQRRQAAAHQADAAWRCKALRGNGVGQACLAELKRESERAP